MARNEPLCQWMPARHRRFGHPVQLRPGTQRDEEQCARLQDIFLQKDDKQVNINWPTEVVYLWQNNELIS